jgi:hypothetical protein
LIDIPGTASRFIPLKQPGAYPITTGIRQLAQALTEPDEVLGHICAHAGVWKATGGEIIDWFKTQAG